MSILDKYLGVTRAFSKGRNWEGLSRVGKRAPYATRLAGELNALSAQGEFA